MIKFEHKPVLLNEVIDGLNIKEDGVYVDMTTGGGGHSYHILKKLKNGHLYCFDQDIMAIEASRSTLLSLSKSNFTMIHSNFRFAKDRFKDSTSPIADGILFDLGVSSFQLDEASRGFSYRFDAPLDMRMNRDDKLTAEFVVNNYSLSQLTDILFNYGEEKYSKNIAKGIVEYRKTKPIKTTFELVDIIKSSTPIKYHIESGHPAKKTFQAIRIEVNSELTILKNSLLDALTLLKSGGRMCVITFHSLEDRIVKQLFKEVSSDSSWHRGMPVSLEQKEIKYKLITKKPILPTEEEIKNNPRAHSAKLRIISAI